MQAAFHERDEEKLLIGIHLGCYERRNLGIKYDKG